MTIKTAAPTASQIAVAVKLIRDSADHIEALQAMLDSPAADDMIYAHASGFSIKQDEKGKLHGGGARFATPLPAGLHLTNGKGEVAQRMERRVMLQKELRDAFKTLRLYGRVVFPE